MDDTLNATNEAQDVEDDFQYDLNGNMISDQNKHIISITYNHLNLPKVVTFEGSNKSIEYLYDATGVKLRKSVTKPNTANNTVENAITEYLGGFQYTSNTIPTLSGGTINVIQLQFFPHAEGYVNNVVIGNKNNFNYVYNYTDHLGNIRLSYTFDEQTGTVQPIDEHHYYPFGLELINIENTAKMAFKMQASTNVIISGVDEAGTRPRLVQVANSGYQYQYNGKEWQDELGLNMTSMDFRQYDNALGRFVGMDRLSELAYDISPYRFALNNPVYFGDPTGLIEMSVLQEMFDRSKGEKTVWENTGSGFSTNDGGFVGYTSDDTSFNRSPGDPNSLQEVIFYGNKSGNFNDVKNWTSYQSVADVIYGNKKSFAEFNKIENQDESYENTNNNSYDVNRYFQRLSISYSYLGLKGDKMLKSGNFIQNNGKIGNFNSKPFSSLSQNAKLNLNYAKGLKAMGTAANFISIGTIAYDVFDDGNIKSSTILNSIILTTTILFPPTAIIALGYGIGDYFFDFSGKLDRNLGEIKTGIYD